jgi:hypothetical protein
MSISASSVAWSSAQKLIPYLAQESMHCIFAFMCTHWYVRRSSGAANEHLRLLGRVDHLLNDEPQKPMSIVACPLGRVDHLKSITKFSHFLSMKNHKNP